MYCKVRSILVFLVCHGFGQASHLEVFVYDKVENNCFKECVKLPLLIHFPNTSAGYRITHCHFITPPSQHSISQHMTK